MSCSLAATRGTSQGNASHRPDHVNQGGQLSDHRGLSPPTASLDGNEPEPRIWCDSITNISARDLRTHSKTACATNPLSLAQTATGKHRLVRQRCHLCIGIFGVGTHARTHALLTYTYANCQPVGSLCNPPRRAWVDLQIEQEGQTMTVTVGRSFRERGVLRRPTHWMQGPTAWE